MFDLNLRWQMGQVVGDELLVVVVDQILNESLAQGHEQVILERKVLLERSRKSCFLMEVYLELQGCGAVKQGQVRRESQQVTVLVLVLNYGLQVLHEL